MIGARMGAEIGGLRPTRHATRPAPRPPDTAPTVGWGRCPPRPVPGQALRRRISRFSRSLRVVGSQLLPVGHCEGREGQDVRRGVRQQLGHQGKMLPELFHHSVQLDVDLCGRRVFFADQLATDGIVERQHLFRAQNGPETAAREGLVIDKLAEGVGFEPTNPCGLTVFKTVAFVHSAIPPRRVARCNQRSRQRLPAHLF